MKYQASFFEFLIFNVESLLEELIVIGVNGLGYSMGLISARCFNMESTALVTDNEGTY